MNAIQDAADLLARARTGAALPGLPEALRPRTLEQAEAIQEATLAAMGDGIGGWKVGRHEGIVFAAPIPASRLLADPVAAPVGLPADRQIELELALSFPAALSPAEVARLAPGDLPDVASLATLFEFVRPRYAAGAPTGPLDRIADCVSNEGAAVRPAAGSWSLEGLDAPPRVILTGNDETLSDRRGPHIAVPVPELLEAWIARLRHAGLGIAAGGVVTLGSLSGILPIPAEGITYTGLIEGLEPLRCTVAPVS